jgi:cytochrome c-type biogenesis protein CcmH
MSLFWALAAALTAGVLLVLLPPLLRRRTAPPDARVAANAAIYHEQLEELGADLQRGAINQEEFERAGREIERRIVAEHASAGPQPARQRTPLAAAVAVGLSLPLLAALGYWQLGSPAALGEAATMAADSAHSITPSQMASLVERLAARMEQSPEDLEGWVLLGRSHGALGNYDRAAQAYARAAQLAPKDAALLADYADTLAMAQGRKLAGEPMALIKRALEADPANLKALALAGSAEFESRNYAAAIGYWERLLKDVPPQSEFARSVASSIDEARSLSGAPPKAASAATAKPAPASQALEGIVSVDPALAAGLSPSDTVFVLARPVSGSRMPLAIARTTVAALPYRFTLDDSMAMAPGATISSHAQVVVAARVSRSGDAVPKKGDVEGSSEPVAPGTRGVRVVLSRVVD